MTGLAAPQASEQVRSAGLVPAIEAIDEADEQLRGVVMGQEPDPDTSLPPGSTVSLLVARPPVATAPSRGPGPPAAEDPALELGASDAAAPQDARPAIPIAIPGLPADEDWYELPTQPRQHEPEVLSADAELPDLNTDDDVVDEVDLELDEREPGATTVLDRVLDDEWLERAQPISGLRRQLGSYGRLLTLGAGAGLGVLAVTTAVHPAALILATYP